jgi:hypothetical protein
MGTQLIKDETQEWVNFVERTGQRAGLKASFDMLTDNDSPLDPFVDIDYIVISRLNRGKDWLSVEYTDGVPLINTNGVKDLFINKCRLESSLERNTSTTDTSGDELPTFLKEDRAGGGHPKILNRNQWKKMNTIKVMEPKNMKLKDHRALRRQEATTNLGEKGVVVSAATAPPRLSRSFNLSKRGTCYPLS